MEKAKLQGEVDPQRLTEVAEAEGVVEVIEVVMLKQTKDHNNKSQREVLRHYLDKQTMNSVLE